MSYELNIDMRGFKVLYMDRTYSCLRMYPYTEPEVMLGPYSYRDVEKLRITVIDSGGRFAILDDLSCAFEFEKE